jgi:hypothetical protein
MAFDIPQQPIRGSKSQVITFGSVALDHIHVHVVREVHANDGVIGCRKGIYNQPSSGCGFLLNPPP